MDQIVSQRIANVILSSGGLAINAGSSTMIKTTNTINAKIDGYIMANVAATSAIGNGTIGTTIGTLPTGYTMALTVSVNASGTFALTASSQILTSSILQGLFPTGSLAPVPQGQCLVGYVIIRNASGSNFVGGTTALDAGSITTLYINGPIF